MAGRLRLAVTGVQDQWLTGEPKISYFSSIYKRHTRFSTEAVGIPITGNVSLGGNAIARIPNNVGDLLRSVMLKLTLGELPSGNLYNASIATSVIQHVDLVIGGQTIQRLTGDYIDMYNQLYSNKDDAGTTLYYMNGHNNQIQIVTAPRTFYLNLPFYFFRNPSLAIPICAITRQLIEIHIKFKDVDDDVTFSYGEVNGNMVRTKTELGSIVEASIITDFYFITRDEINFLLTRPMQYIITQLQLSTMQFKPNETKKSALLKFTNPVKELFFLAKEETGATNVFEPVYAISQPVGVFEFEIHESVISNNGLVAVVANTSVGADHGSVIIFEKDSSGNWPSTPSATYNGSSPGEYFGRVLGVSDDGTRVAMQSSSKTMVVEKQSSGWTQIGSDITASFNAITGSCMSGDGTKVFGTNGSDVYSWEYSGSSWSQYRPDITVSNTISRISHSTNGEILGLEDATKTVIHATTGSASTYTKRHTDTQYSERYHSLSSDGANLVSLETLGSKVWNGSDYVYDGAGGTQVPWYTTSASSFVEISGNGNFVFWVDNATDRFRIYSKSVVDGKVQWTLKSSIEYLYTPVKMSALGSDAIIVTGSGSAGAKIYDISVTPVADEDRLLNISSTDQAFSGHVANKRSDYRFVKNIRFECNGKRMFDHTGKYLAYEQSLIHHTGCPDPAYEFYTYSFALKPELYYPTGQLNMSRIIHKKLDVELDETSTSRNINFSIYALNYNLLHVEGGLAGLKF